MSIPQKDEEARRMLAEDRRRADRDNTRRIWAALLFAAYLYVAILELPHNLIKAAYSHPVGAGLVTQYMWEFDAGIGNEEAGTIVVGLAAFVITINVAVFAARLGVPQDARSELDLARWQRSMEWLAPVACSAAFAVAATRIPKDIGLFAGLALVSAVALGASDVRIAGRLSALRMEETTAEHLAAHAEEQKEYLRNSLPGAVRNRLHESRVGIYASELRISLMVAAIVGGQTILLALIMGREFILPSPASPGPFIVGLFLVWVFLLMTTGWAHFLIIHAFTWKLEKRAAQNDPDAEHSRKWRVWLPVVQVAAIVASAAITVTLMPVQPLLLGGSVVTACAIQYLIIQVALLTGRGPGLVVVWLAMAKAANEADSAIRSMETAKATHHAEAKRQGALAPSPEEPSQTMSLAQGFKGIFKSTSR